MKELPLVPSINVLGRVMGDPTQAQEKNRVKTYKSSKGEDFMVYWTNLAVGSGRKTEEGKQDIMLIPVTFKGNAAKFMLGTFKDENPFVPKGTLIYAELKCVYPTLEDIQNQKTFKGFFECWNISVVDRPSKKNEQNVDPAQKIQPKADNNNASNGWNTFGDNSSNENSFIF